MPSKLSSCVVGIDVGGTNTDAVILQNNNVLAWHKTPTTSDIQAGVEQAIHAVLKKAAIPSSHVDSVKIGTTQFINAVLEQDSSKLDKVAVIRLCGQYSKASPPFVDFPPTLRTLMEGHYGYVDGGIQVDGTPISDINVEEIKEQAAIIKSKSIKSIVVIGIYSPSNPAQEIFARSVLAKELGPEYDISCSHAIGRLGFIERENASILNASLRRFARHVISGFQHAVQKLGRGRLYITLNDGTLSKASTATEYPVRCFSSGPTNSARGAALLAKLENIFDPVDDREVLVIDVGGTTTDICTLLQSGYPRQSAAFVKIAGVRTNFTIPDVHSIALGGGSVVRQGINGRTSVGPDSVGSRLESEAIIFGGTTLTTTDLVLSNDKTNAQVSAAIKRAGLNEIQRCVEASIDLVKTKEGDAKVILVGGGSIIIDERIAGVAQIIRPKYLEVANAVGAAIGKISGTVDTVVVPDAKTIEQLIEEARSLAIERCVAAGGDKKTVQTVEIEVVPMSYVTNGATRVVVRVVGDLSESYEEMFNVLEQESGQETFHGVKGIMKSATVAVEVNAPELSKASNYEVIEHIDLESYRPILEGDIWYLSEIDLGFLLDGAGVLGVGSCGESYPSYIACLLALRNGSDLRIMRQQAIADDAVVLAAGFMGSPSVYLERIPGLEEIPEAIQGVIQTASISAPTTLIPTEIGGLNALVILLAAAHFKLPVLDTDTVARAYPKVWQTVRCLDSIPVTPSCISSGSGPGQTIIFATSSSDIDAEDQMRDACTSLGSLAAMCVNPLTGKEARELPENSFSRAWSIGRSIALARERKGDVVKSLLEGENGMLVFLGKIVEVSREVSGGFTRGKVLLEPISGEIGSVGEVEKLDRRLLVEFENENLIAVERVEGKEDKVLACCPDLITFLDMANGAPLGISDYKYGLRVNVIALCAPLMWTTEKGLEMGGPRAFGLDIDYKGISTKEYTPPKSVWEIFKDV